MYIIKPGNSDILREHDIPIFSSRMAPNAILSFRAYQCIRIYGIFLFPGIMRTAS